MNTKFSRRTWFRYLRWTGATTFAVVAAAGLFNGYIDPLNVFELPRAKGINAIKPHLDHHRDLTVYKSALRLCTDTGIFGNSRFEVGLDPYNSEFAAHRMSAFNYSIAGTTATTAFLQLVWLEASRCMPRNIILGVEFFDFLGGAKLRPLPTLETNPVPRLDAQFFAESVFSVTAIRDSLTTIAAQYESYPATTTDRGFNPMLNYIPEVARSGHYVLFRLPAQQYVARWKSKPPRIRPPDGNISNDEATLNAIVYQAGQAKSTTYLVIYPYHAEIRIILERLGLGQLFTEWKRLIVANAERSASLGNKVEVWDFSGISPETLEAIPEKGDRLTRLRWYWEPGHFKKELGNLMVTRLLGGPGSFGVKLNNGNLDAWLAEDRRRVQALVARPSALLNEVDDLIGTNQLVP